MTSPVEEHFQARIAGPQISPLRCAPVEMTKGRAALPLSVVAEQKVFLITLGGPKAHDFSGRDGKRLLFSHLFLEEPLSPLSSRPELRRSVVERSAVSAVLGSVFRYAGALFPVASTVWKKGASVSLWTTAVCTFSNLDLLSNNSN